LISGQHLYELLLIPNIVVFSLIVVALVVKYEHSAKVSYALVDFLSRLYGSIFYRIYYSVYIVLDETQFRFRRSVNGWFSAKQSYCKYDRTEHASISESHSLFFRRPKPVIEVQPFRGGDGLQNINVFGVKTVVFGRDAKELWISVTNAGKNPVKRLRARVRIISLQPLTKQYPQNKPENMADDQWVQLLQTQLQFLAKMEHELAQSMFGRQLPFVRIPPGTVPLHWTQLDRRDVYELDLTANDEK